MALLAAAPFIEAAVAEGPELLAAAQMANDLAHRYGPKVHGAVNNLMHLGRKKKSVKHYIKGLGTKKGLKKFFTKDIRKGLSATKGFIDDVSNVGDEIAQMTQDGKKGGAVGHHANRVAQALKTGASHANRYHHMAEMYHSGAEQLVSPLKAYRF